MNIKDKQNLLEAYKSIAKQNKRSRPLQLNEAGAILPAAGVAAAGYGLKKASDVADWTGNKIAGGLGNLGARMTAGLRGISGSQAVQERQANLAWKDLFAQLDIVQKNGIDVSVIKDVLQQLKDNPDALKEVPAPAAAAPAAPSAPAAPPQASAQGNPNAQQQQQASAQGDPTELTNQRIADAMKRRAQASQRARKLAANQMKLDHEYRMARLGLHMNPSTNTYVRFPPNQSGSGGSPQVDANTGQGDASYDVNINTIPMSGVNLPTSADTGHSRPCDLLSTAPWWS